MSEKEMSDAAIPLKKCWRCKRELPATTEYFHKDSSKNDGLHGMCKECSKEHGKAYYEKRKEHLREWHQKHYRRKKRQATRKKAWAARQAKLAALANELTEEEWQETLQEFDYKCAYCGAEGNLQKDHVIPVDSGGGTVKWNVVPACVHCNASKAEADLTCWYLHQPFFSLERLMIIFDFMRRYKPPLEESEPEDEELEDTEDAE